MRSHFSYQHTYIAFHAQPSTFHARNTFRAHTSYTQVTQTKMCMGGAISPKKRIVETPFDQMVASSYLYL